MMNLSTLSGELENLEVGISEPNAIEGWSAAYKEFFRDAAANEIPINELVLLPAQQAMKVAMIGLSAQNAGASKLQAGILAFWGYLVANFSIAWSGSTGLTPAPSLGGLAGILTGVFSANTSGQLSRLQASLSVATAVHGASQGGMVIYPGAPPVTFPIL